jgi:hypothetical protein
MMKVLRPGWLDWSVAATMALLLPVAPFVAALIARDWRYAVGYPQTLLRAAGHLRGQVRSAAASRYRAHARGQLPPPERVVGACTHCGNCCLDRRCVFLDWSPRGESRCRIYGTAFWKRLACGRYPENGMDIALYSCPSFRAEPPAAPDRNKTRT